MKKGQEDHFKTVRLFTSSSESAFVNGTGYSLKQVSHIYLQYLELLQEELLLFLLVNMHDQTLVCLFV